MPDEHRLKYHTWPLPGPLPEGQSRDFVYDITKYKRRVFSQHGEEGALERLFNLIKIDTGWCCEFGAADGKWFSNTRYLIMNGWKGLLIESSLEHLPALKEYQNEYPDRIIIMWEAIACMKYKGITLDTALSRTPIPKNFELLSIDVDGPDYWLWKNLKEYRPKVVIIEQSGIEGYHIHEKGVGRHDPRRTTSFEPLRKLGESKGYTLVALLGNMIFVADEYIR